MKHVLREIDLAQRRLRYRIASIPWAPWFPAVLETESFRGKRVIIIGPAETVLDDLSGSVVDEYDVVVRLNNGITLAETRPEVLGKRTDLLIHNLRETGARSAGSIPSAYLKDKNVGLLVFPHWHSSRQRKMFRAKEAALKAEHGPEIRVLPPSIISGLKRALNDRSPTIGMSACVFFLGSPAAEVAIHGFTFFETAYAPSYNPMVQSAEDAKRWVHQLGAHDPVTEKTFLQACLSRSTVERVTLGANVRKYLYAE